MSSIHAATTTLVLAAFLMGCGASATSTIAGPSEEARVALSELDALDAADGEQGRYAELATRLDPASDDLFVHWALARAWDGASDGPGPELVRALDHAAWAYRGLREPDLGLDLYRLYLEADMPVGARRVRDELVATGVKVPPLPSPLPMIGGELTDVDWVSPLVELSPSDAFAIETIELAAPGPVELVVQRGPDGMLAAASRSNDGRYLATFGLDGVLNVWDLELGLLVRGFQQDGRVVRYQDRADDLVFIATAQGDLRLWDIAHAVPNAGFRVVMEAGDEVFDADLGDSLGVVLVRRGVEFELVTFAVDGGERALGRRLSSFAPPPHKEHFRSVRVIDDRVILVSDQRLLSFELETLELVAQSDWFVGTVVVHGDGITVDLGSAMVRYDKDLQLQRVTEVCAQHRLLSTIVSSSVVACGVESEIRVVDLDDRGASVSTIPVDSALATGRGDAIYLYGEGQGLALSRYERIDKSFVGVLRGWNLSESGPRETFEEWYVPSWAMGWEGRYEPIPEPTELAPGSYQRTELRTAVATGRDLVVSAGNAAEAALDDNQIFEVRDPSGVVSGEVRFAHRRPYRTRLSPRGESLAISHSQGPLAIWNLDTGTLTRDMDGVAGRELSWSPDGSRLLSGSNDGFAVWSSVSGARERIIGPPINTQFELSTWLSTGNLALVLPGPLVDNPGAPIAELASTGARALFVLAPDGRRVYADPVAGPVNTLMEISESTVLTTGHQLARYHAAPGVDLPPLHAGPFEYEIRASQVSARGESLLYWSEAGGGWLQRIDSRGRVIWATQMDLVPAAVSSQATTIAVGGRGGIALFDYETGELAGQIELAALDFVESIELDEAAARAFVNASDGSIRVYDLARRVELCRLYSFHDGSWAVVDGSGRYDASAGGRIEGLHWVAGTEVIALDQLKERFYEPGLLAKHLGRSDEPLRPVTGLERIDLFPDVDLRDTGRGELELTVENRGGGIGRIEVFVNGRQVMADARGAGPLGIAADAEQASLSLAVADHPFVKPGEENDVEVRVYNADGYLSSRGVSTTFVGAGASSTEPPSLHAVIVGVSDYAGEAIDLKFAAHDADQFAAALELAATSMFESERVHIELLSSGAGSHPGREAIREAFVRAAERAQPGDIIIAYFAGHGVELRHRNDSYAFLTADANGTDLIDPAVVSAVAISHDDLTGWLQDVPANKQVLILDTCASGAMIAPTETRSRSTDQIRAIERMKDRTGTHILMGSAADSVSYEASRFGQGLLTYSLLQAMKGAALRDGTYVDVVQLFNHAADTVPILAETIGGIQQPVVSSPGGHSFDIGMLDPAGQAQIELASPRPVLVQPVVLDLDAVGDPLGLQEQVQNGLRELDREADAVYLDVRAMADAIEPRVGYRQVRGGGLAVTIKLWSSGAVVGEAQLELEEDAPLPVAAAVVAKIVELAR